MARRCSAPRLSRSSRATPRARSPSNGAIATMTAVAGAVSRCRADPPDSVAIRFSKPEDVVARLKPLTKPDSPWFGTAGELTAVALLKEGKKTEAGQLFAALARSKTVPDAIRSRAIQMASTPRHRRQRRSARSPIGQMMTRMNSSSFAVLSAAIAASGCSILKKSTPNTPVLGQRIDVLSTENDISGRSRDRRLADDPSRTPVVNPEWAQSGGNPPKSMGQVRARPHSRARLHRSGGRGQQLDGTACGMRRLLPAGTSSPSTPLGRAGLRRAERARSCGQHRRRRIRDNERHSTAAASPTTAAASTRPTASAMSSRSTRATAASFGRSARADPLRGAPERRQRRGLCHQPGQPDLSRSRKTDGSTNWSQAASLEVAGIFGSASPAVGQGTVVAGFSSGELNAYRYENGRQVWQDACSARASAPACRR